MSRNSHSNNNENVVWIFVGLMVIVGIWLWRFINGVAQGIGVEFNSALILMLGALFLAVGLCTAYLKEWGGKAACWMGVLFAPFLAPAIRDWAQTPSMRLGAQFGRYEEATRAWWGHGLFLFAVFAVIVFVAWLLTKDGDY